MSKTDSFLSKEQENLLNAFRKQIKSAPSDQVTASPPSPKPDVKLVEKDLEQNLFQKEMQGVKKFKPSNRVIIDKPKKKALNAQILAKRIAAEGYAESEHTSLLSDTQAALNPVGSQQNLSYRITTLPNKVFDELKTGKLRWFEAVDLHGCTIEQARSAVLEIIQMAKNENQTVIKIVHGKGPEAILKTYVNGWLKQHQDVLAFVSAPEKQGGTGAVLALLKRTHQLHKDKP